MMTRLKKTLAVVGVSAAAIGLTGCAVGPAAASGNSQVTAQAATAESDERDRTACMGFSGAMEDFQVSGRTAAEAGSVDGYADALSVLAYDIGTHSVEAGKGSEVQVALQDAASAAATATDEYGPTGNVSTTNWLAVQTTVASAAEHCDLPGYTFE